jgi:hypothetical protein
MSTIFKFILLIGKIHYVGVFGAKSIMFKGIVSRDWEGLLMVLLDKYEVLDITA